MSGLESVLPERHTFPLSATLAGATVALECAALRYPVSHRGLTLILTHGVSHCKEQYHTTITRLLDHQHGATYGLREIWSIDFPNHGEAAVLNRRLLDASKAREGANGSCTTTDLGVYLNAFLSLPRFHGHTLVGVAHSGSCTAWVHALTTHHTYPSALVLVEPTLMFPDMSPSDPRSVHGAANVRGARVKKDRWASRAELAHWMATSGKKIWARWDPRVLRLYVEHGFEELVTPEGAYVTPRLRKDEEAPMYECLAHTVEPGQLAALCTALNRAGRRGVHIVWAEYEEFISKTAKAEILAAAEHRVATQRTVKGSGHLVPQMKPDALGDAIHEVLGMVGGTKSLL